MILTVLFTVYVELSNLHSILLGHQSLVVTTEKRKKSVDFILF